MSPYVVYIFLCATSTSHADCDRRTALDVVMGPSAANEIACGFGAQALMAQSDITPTDGEYMKIACLRRADVASNP